MTTRQKDYIEKNVYLLDHIDTWETFFRNSPEGVGGILYEAGVDFMSVLGYIPTRAFAHCFNITSVTISDGVTSIGDGAFFSCKGLKSIIIPDSVMSIGDWAFGGCSSLNSITIPDSVTSIDSKAFYNCSSLTNVNFNGTKSQWETITKRNIFDQKGKKIMCADGIIDIT